jgi:UV DNA damage endonuclease
MNRLGYACINMTLAEQGVKTSRRMIKRTFEKKGIEYASELAVLNATDLKKIVQWNNENGIGVFRITSDLVPWATEFMLEDMPDYEEFARLLGEVGDEAASGGQRLSFHPGPFNCLGSPSEKVVKNCYKDLNHHGELMDLLKQPRSRWAKINIHVGGSYGDHNAAMERFCENFEGLDESVRTRLTVENDDKPGAYSTKMLYEGISTKVGVPIVFDSHHFQLGPQDSTYAEALGMAASTWEGVRPTCHHSNSRRNYEDPKVRANAHSDYYYEPFDFLDYDNLDVVLEAKAKERALIKYLEKWQVNSKNEKVA